MNISDLLFALIRCELKGEKLSDEVKASLTDDNLKKLFSLSSFHDCAHLLYNPIANSGVVSSENEYLKKFLKKQRLALFQISQIEYEINRIKECLNDNKIPFILLKGAVLRQLYPQPWMRTSCDIDILVHEEDLDRAVNSIKSGLSYTQKGEKDFHDISLYSPTEIQLELHFTIREDMENIDKVLEKVWDYSSKKPDSYEYVPENEFFIFHIISHCAYHFVNGGCGIRPFLDIWFIEKKYQFDRIKLYELLEQCSLKSFYENAVNLSEVWMSNASHTSLTQRMELYIFGGGSYGTRENAITLRSSKKKNKLFYLFSRAFPPFKSMKIRYPHLSKLPFLLPAYYIKRFIELLMGNKNEKAFYELKTTMHIDEDKNTEMTDLISSLGL